MSKPQDILQTSGIVEPIVESIVENLSTMRERIFKTFGRTQKQQLRLIETTVSLTKKCILKSFFHKNSCVYREKAVLLHKI